MDNESKLKSNIWKIYFSSFFGTIELYGAVFVLFLLSNDLTMTEVMILETIFTVAIFFLEIPSGAFADRIGRKWSLALSGLFAALSFYVFGIGTIFWTFLIAQILIAASWAFNSGARSALIYDTLKELKQEKKYGKIFGRMYSIEMITLGFANLIGGFIAENTNYRYLFFISAIFALIGSLFNLSMKEPQIHKHLQEQNYFKHLKSAIKFSFSHKIIRNLIIYFGTFAALGHLLYFVVQPYYDYAGFSERFIGFAEFIYFGMSAVGAWMAWRLIKRVSEKKLLYLLLGVMGLAMTALSVVGKMWALVLIGIITFTEGVRNIFIDEEINKYTDSHHRATVISVKSMSKSIIYAIAAPLIGFVMDVYSPEAAFLMMGIGLMVFLVYIVFLFGIGTKWKE